MSMTRVQHRPWRKYGPYYVEIRRWRYFLFPQWEYVETYKTYEEAAEHASLLAHDGYTKKVFDGQSSWTP